MALGIGNQNAAFTKECWTMFQMFYAGQVTVWLVCLMLNSIALIYIVQAAFEGAHPMEKGLLVDGVLGSLLPCLIHYHTIWLHCWFNCQSLMCGSLTSDEPSLSSPKIYNRGREEVSGDKGSMSFNDWMMDDLKRHSGECFTSFLR